MLKLQEHLPNRSKKEIVSKLQRYKKNLKKTTKAEAYDVSEILAKVKPKNEIDSKFWSELEHYMFEEAIKRHGVDKDQIHKMVPTRTIEQILARIRHVRQNNVVIDPVVLEIVKKS